MKPLLIVLALARGGDMVSTRVGINHGLHEANPLILSERRGVLEGQLAAETALQIVLIKKLERRHPKLAKALTFAQIGISSAAVVHNVQMIRRDR